MKQLLPILFLGILLLLPLHASASREIGIDECIRLVISGSNSLHMARAVTDQKKALLSSATKDRYPTVSALLTTTHQTEPVPDYFPDNMFTYGLSVAQPLYKGNAITSGIDQAETTMQIAEFESIRTINDLVFGVYKLYFSLLRAEKLEDEEEQAVLRLKAHLKDSSALFKVGFVPRSALLQSEVELAQGQQDLVDAQNRTENARSQLNTAMRRDIAASLSIKDISPDDSIQFTWIRVQTALLKNRPEITQARLEVTFAEEGIPLSAAPFLPDVTLHASYSSDIDYEPSTIEDTDRWSRENAMVKVNASWRLWTWSKDDDEKFAAKMALRRAKYNLSEVIDTVTLEARTAFLHIDQGAKRVRVSQKAIEHARENYRINQTRYQQQIATSTDVLDAQELLTKAITNYYDSLYGYELAKAAVWRAQGTFGQRYTVLGGQEQEQEQQTTIRIQAPRIIAANGITIGSLQILPSLASIR